MKNEVMSNDLRDDVFDVLSDEALLEKVEDLARRERRMTFNVVMHLGEVERRRIYVREGYASMFDYCTRRLGYSESAACRRIKTYRCIRDFPEVAGLVRSGQLSTVTVAMISGALTQENYTELLKAASGKSQRDVQRIVAGYKTGKPFRDRIKAVVVERPAMSLAIAPPRGETSAPKLGQIHRHDGGKNAPTSQSKGCSNGALARPAGPVPAEDTALREASASSAASHAVSPQQPGRETYYEFTIAGDEEFMRMYQRVRAIQSSKANPGGDIATTFKALMSEYIARHAPEEKQKRHNKRAQRARSKGKPKAGVQAETVGNGSQARDGEPALVHTRHIPSAVKDHVRMRDQYRCAYVGGDGVRCGSTRHLQFDHVVPFAKGGGHEPENLRLLCAAHNRLEAAGVFGVGAAHRGRGRFS